MEWKIDDAFKFGAKIGSKHSNSCLSISSCFAPCSSRFTLGGESRQKNLADSQKSSWTGFVWFYRVSLRFIEFYRATSPPPPSLYFILRDFSSPPRREKRFAVCQRNEAKKEQKIKSRWCNFHEPCRAICRFDSSSSSDGANTLESRSLDILYQSPPLLSTTMRLLLTCFHFSFFKFTKQCEFQFSLIMINK